MIKKVVRDTLLADSTVTDALATYAFTTGDSQAAIFAGRRIPDDAKYPAVFISLVGGSAFECRAQRGAEIDVDANVYDDRDTSDATLEALAVNIWKALNRADLGARLASQGYEDWGCHAEYPMYRADDDTFPGYLVRVRVRTLEA